MADRPASEERWFGGSRPGVPDVDPTVLSVLERQRAASSAWAEVYDEARQRMVTDPLLAARVHTAASLVAERTSRRSDGLADGWVRTGAAVALVIAERPELLTGEPPRRRPAVEVLARVLDPLVRVYSFTPATDGHLEALKLARSLLQALALDGYEVAVRADRFASLDHDGSTTVRIPMRGRCAICRGPVTRDLDGGPDELLVGPWHHRGERAGDGGGHLPAGVEPR